MVVRSVSLAVASAALAVICGCKEEPRMYSTRAEKGEVIFRDDFERPELGSAWSATGEGAWIEDGVLKVRGLKNHPLWLVQSLPDNVRIEFDTWAQSEEGDIKVEVGGDGSSFATSLNYTASGYVMIFGGWNNSMSALVRRNEHGRDRVTTGEPKVEADRRYHVVLTRTGNELYWELDGREMLLLEDLQPLRGEGQDHFAFSGWESEVHFDNLIIEDLSAATKSPT